MTSASRLNRSPQVLQHAILWGAWSELGLSGWSRSHRNWAIDPEPLIIATPLAAHGDTRLRDEALDWCVHNWRYVSKVRLRNLLRNEVDEVVDAFAPFAATVNHHAGGAAWPEASAEPWQYATTGRSTPPRLSRPSMVWLRLRAVFGLGARTEILRYFLAHPGQRASATALADFAGYNKRNVADACLTLEQAGILAKHQIANRLYYRLDREAELRDLLGELAPISPDWSALLHLARALARMLDQEDSLPGRALGVEARRTLRDLADDLGKLDLGPPAIQDDYWTMVGHFARVTLEAWANGRPAT